MFRTMRRQRQQLPQDEALRLLQEGVTGILGVQGDDGYPYTVPINYVYADGKVYFHGAKAGHKYDAIRRCDKVSLCVVGQDTVCAERLTTLFRSVVLFGRARVLEDRADIVRAASLLGLRYGGDTAQVEAETQREMPGLCCFEITVEQLTGKEAIELTREREAK